MTPPHARAPEAPPSGPGPSVIRLPGQDRDQPAPDHRVLDLRGRPDTPGQPAEVLVDEGRRDREQAAELRDQHGQVWGAVVQQVTDGVRHLDAGARSLARAAAASADLLLLPATGSPVQAVQAGVDAAHAVLTLQYELWAGLLTGGRTEVR